LLTEARDGEVDRLYWMIAKQYNLILWDVSFSEKMKISSNKGLSYLLIAKSLERMADHAKKIAINIRLHSEENKILTAEIKNISKKLIDLANASIAAFFSGRFEDTNDILGKAKKLDDDIQELTGNIMKREDETSATIAYAYVLDSLNRICSYTRDIAETAVNGQFIED
jgi:phosphate uptake regulator